MHFTVFNVTSSGKREKPRLDPPRQPTPAIDVLRGSPLTVDMHFGALTLDETEAPTPSASGSAFEANLNYATSPEVEVHDSHGARRPIADLNPFSLNPQLEAADYKAWLEERALNGSYSCNGMLRTSMPLSSLFAHRPPPPPPQTRPSGLRRVPPPHNPSSNASNRPSLHLVITGLQEANTDDQTPKRRQH